MRMKGRENVAKASAILIAAGVVGLEYLYIKRAEEKKRAKIALWEQENLACIENFKTTMQRVIEDPNTTSAEFWRRFREESTFLNITIHQPMY